MADPTPAPLTAAEQKQLDALNAKKLAADNYQREQERQAVYAALAKTGDLVALLSTDQIRDALTAAIAANPEPEVLERLLRIRNTIFTIDVPQLAQKVEAVKNPLPGYDAATAPPSDTPSVP